MFCVFMLFAYTLEKIRHELFPPKPNEFDKVFLTSWFSTSFATGPKLNSSIFSLKFKLGIKKLLFIESMHIIASTEPAALVV